jgi:hypothetical protein
LIVAHKNPVKPRRAAAGKEVTVERLNPWRTGAALALATAILNAVCAIAVYANPEGVIAFVNSWWHGLDLRLIRNDKPWTPGSLLLGLFNAGVTGFVVGSVFAGCYNLVAARPKGSKPLT